MVTVDGSGRVDAVLATREETDPNRDLWWAHTGGGGGNFGVVTRYWFRTPNASGTDPVELLPRPPATVLSFSMNWPWQGMDQKSFTNLVRNYGRWHTGENDRRLYGELFVHRRVAGAITLFGQIAGAEGADSVLDEHIAALSHGVGPAPIVQREVTPWLTSALAGLAGEHGERWRMKQKSSYLREPLTDRQLDVAYHHLTAPEPAVAGGSLTLASYGGRVNTVGSSATASPQRDSILKLFLLASWDDPGQDSAYLQWARDFYRELYADTGGVPIPNAANDGCYINYPDVDVADPQWNTSGTPWHALYYKEAYGRLRKVKARWDPRGVFHHALSIRNG